MLLLCSLHAFNELCIDIIHQVKGQINSEEIRHKCEDYTKKVRYFGNKCENNSKRVR